MPHLMPPHFPLPMFSGMTSIALVAHGAVHDMHWIVGLLKQYPAVVAVDGGLDYCHEMGITPNLIIGDLDSLSHEILEQYQSVPIEKFHEDKPWTDLDLAVMAVNSPSMEKIAVFGALEGRTDHCLSNLQLLRCYPGKMVIETERETIISLQRKQVLDVFPGQTLSLIPLGPSAKNVTTKGLKWELKDATLDKEFMSVSNICLSFQEVIDIGQGDLMCCISRT